MSKLPSRPAPAEDPVGTIPQDRTDPIESFLAEVFSAVDVGQSDRVDEIMAEEAARQKAGRGPSVQLISHIQMSGNKDRDALRKRYAALQGDIRLITRGNPGKHFDAVSAGRSWQRSVIGTILNDLAPRDVIRIRPTILVGPPGCGKTTLARALATELALPYVVYPAAGVADGTFGGTAAHWSNTAPSVVVQLMLQHLVANPMIIIDEIDKATEGSPNGSLKDVLLGFLDRGNASVFRDPSLETVVDCSHVNWLLTANDPSQIPGPLKDRCRIINVPDPEWRHVHDVCRSILDSIAEERDLDRRWIADLDGDEVQLIGRLWRGGSIRKLRRIVETMIDVRDRHLPSC